MYLRRIPLTDVPADEKEAAQFLHEMFIRKDKMQESFHTHGDFFTGSGVTRVEPIVHKSRLCSLFNTLFWIVTTLTPILYSLMNLLLSGELVYFSIGALIILACKYFFEIFL